jgi:hypothetical protein
MPAERKVQVARRLFVAVVLAQTLPILLSNWQDRSLTLQVHTIRKEGLAVRDKLNRQRRTIWLLDAMHQHVHH